MSSAASTSIHHESILNKQPTHTSVFMTAADGSDLRPALTTLSYISERRPVVNTRWRSFGRGRKSSNRKKDAAVPTLPTAASSTAPDGGLVAWAQVFAGHLIAFTTWGYINSFGLFQPYYVASLHSTPSAISWIGSTQIYLLFFSAIVAGRLVDAGYLHTTMLAGCTLHILCVVCSSFCTAYYQLFLAQGIGCGVAGGFLFTPAVAVVSSYFERNRALAMGISIGGSAIGGMVFPLAVRALLPQIGFAWTIRALALIMLVSLAVAMAVLRRRLQPRKRGPWVDWGALRDMHFVLVGLGTFLYFWGAYVAVFYLRAYAESLGFSANQSIDLIAIMNGVGFVGRVIPAFLADRYGCFPVLIFCAFATGLLCLVWISVKTYAGLVVFASIYGFFSSGFQVMFPATVAAITDGDKLGTRLGMLFAFVGLGTLTGPPIGGALVTAMNGKYVGAQAFGGVVTMGGSVVLSGAWWALRKYDKGANESEEEVEEMDGV